MEEKTSKKMNVKISVTKLFKIIILLFIMTKSYANDIPDWNLNSIYPELESNEYRQDFTSLKNSLESLESLLETAQKFSISNENFDFSLWFKTYLDEYCSAFNLYKTLHEFGYILYSTDTTNTEYLNNISAVQDIGISFSKMELKFYSILIAYQEKLNDFYRQFPDYSRFEYFLNECITKFMHMMSGPEEQLAEELQKTGGNAWSRLQEQLISSMHDEEGRTFNELRNDANSADPIERKNAWQKEKALLKQNEIAFAASLNNLKGETAALNKRRNWKKAIDRSLFTSRLQPETLNALIGAIEDSLPMWRDYLQTKALLLRKTNSTASKTAGTPEHKGIAFYDLFAPISPLTKENAKDSLFTKNWTFTEAKEYVLKEFYSFSKDMGDFAKQAFENNWIDARVHEGKVGGAYDSDFPKGHQSRVLTNFTGTFSDIITLSHELGHAYHFSCMKGLSGMLLDFPMTLAETASTFAETIVKQDAIAGSTGFEKISMIETELQDVCQVLVDILSRFYFENSVFELRKDTELTAEDFCRLMNDAQEKSYGNGLNDEELNGNYTERHEYMWAVKSHYYIVDFDFYNYPYAFGQLFAAGLYERSKKEGKQFAAAYAELLSNTSSMSCEDLCRKAGFDITKKDFWASGIEVFREELEIFKKYVQQ